jgi:chromosome segregation ATPase
MAANQQLQSQLDLLVQSVRAAGEQLEVNQNKFAEYRSECERADERAKQFVADLELRCQKAENEVARLRSENADLTTEALVATNKLAAAQEARDLYRSRWLEAATHAVAAERERRLAADKSQLITNAISAATDAVLACRELVAREPTWDEQRAAHAGAESTLAALLPP